MSNQMSSVVEALKRASKGLMMPSESDAPFEAVDLDSEPTPSRIHQVAGAPKDASIEETSLNELFGTVPSGDRSKFQRLRQAIESQLSGVKVYKVGDQPERTVPILGKGADSRWAGLKTTVVET